MSPSRFRHPVSRPIARRQRAFRPASAARATILATAAAGVALLGVSGLAQGASAKPKLPTRCNRLKGKNLLPSPRLRLVRVTLAKTKVLRNAHDVLGCVRPHGRVRVITADGIDTLQGSVVGGSTYRLGATAGTHLIVQEVGGDQTGDSVTTDLVVDVKTGRRYRYFVNDTASRTGHTATTPPPVSVTLGPQGLLAGIFTDDGKTPGSFPDAAMTLVIGFEANGTRRVLDRAPAGAIAKESLKLSGRTVSWTDAGAAKTATL